MDLKNLFATANIRQPDIDLAVETTWSQQCLIQHIGTVGGSDNNYALITFKAVHFNQQLVEGLLALVVAAAPATATVTTDRIDLVDKDNAGGLLFRLFKHVANPGRTHADKHFHKVRTGNREEWYLGFTGNSLGQQGLTSTWWANHQHTLGYTATEALEFARVAEEFHQLTHIFLGFIDTGYIGKGGVDLVTTEQLGLALAKAHRAATATAAALHLAHKEDKDSQDQQYREGCQQQLRQQTWGLRLLADHFHIVVEQVIHQAGVLDIGSHGFKG